MTRSHQLRRSLARHRRRFLGARDGVDTGTFWEAVRREHPPLAAAIAADARITANRRGDRDDFRSKLDLVVQVVRLMIVTESFFGQCCYRAKAHCQVLGIPLVPRILNHLAVAHGQIAIGDPVMIQAGVFIPHGQVCIDGVTRIGAGAVIGPFVTIGLVSGEYAGPTIGRHVMIGTGARVLGPVAVGDRAVIGANAVVTDDVPAGCTAVGIPARVQR